MRLSRSDVVVDPTDEPVGYLQVVFVKKESGSPTDILYNDRFIQITIVLWVACIYVLLYLPHSPIFNK